ncbi:16S rRNA (cytidine(1402)-2'-O)-methyltransferase [Candidatus Parcubacteria bacterium]|nr:16S rRNA (cytidine(1402)-2'-O)-methyltransferase [Candidatus Parcubacteria bacterium]
MATLYVVSTPIGNLEDITLRALRILNEADAIVCEDTRVTKKLLFHFGISKPLLSYHSQSAQGKTKDIIKLLEEGKNLALVSDAGTPAVSDPGALLVGAVRAALGEDVKIESVPGPSALTAALSVIGAPAAEFLFLGFLPHKKGREKLFKEIASIERAVVFYESPHRFMKTLASLKKVAPMREIRIARELTKIHEEVAAGTPEQLIAYFNTHKEKARGEFVFIVLPA